MTHAPKWRALVAMHEGALSDAGEARLTAHLSDCDVCQDALRCVRAYDQVAGEVRDAPVPTLAGDVAPIAALASVIAEVRASSPPAIDWDALGAKLWSAQSVAHSPKWRALIAHHEEALSPEATARLERHLATCSVCTDALANMNTYDGVTSELRSVAPVVDFAKLELSVRRAAKARRTERWLSGAVVAMAAAAALFMVLRPTPGQDSTVIPGEAVAHYVAPPEAAMQTATVVAVGGDARIGDRIIEVGASLVEQEVLQLVDGAVHVRIADHTGFVLEGDAELALSRMREDGVTLALHQGRVSSQVLTGTVYAVEAAEYSVHVRGTRFDVRRDGEEIAVTVDEGVVEVRLGDEVIAVLPAPATWSSHPDHQASALGSVLVARALAEGAEQWPVLSLPITDNIVRWEVDGSTFEQAGAIAMRAPAGPLTVLGFDASGRRHELQIELADEGFVVEADAMAPQRPRAGYLRPEDIQEVVRPSIGRMQRCYERTLRQMNPELQGAYTLRVTVGHNGAVRRVRVITDAETPPPFVTCLRVIAGRWQFPSPEDGPTATFNLPLSFSPR